MFSSVCPSFCVSLLVPVYMSLFSLLSVFFFSTFSCFSSRSTSFFLCFKHFSHFCSLPVSPHLSWSLSLFFLPRSLSLFVLHFLLSLHFPLFLLLSLICRYNTVVLLSFFVLVCFSLYLTVSLFHTFTHALRSLSLCRTAAFLWNCVQSWGLIPLTNKRSLHRRPPEPIGV